MSVIHTYIPRSDIPKIRAVDRAYLKRKIDDGSALSNLMHRKVNKTVLNELQRILDETPIPRHRSNRRLNSNVSVYKDGKLVRIESPTGRPLTNKEL